MVYDAEALSWLSNNKNDSALAGNRFGNTANAIKAVKKLYAAGATRVDVCVAYDEPRRIERAGGPYADELTVYFTRETRKDVLKVIRSLRPDNFDDMTKADWVELESGETTSLELWWD